MKKVKRICVIGLGLFGRQLAEQLAEEAEVLAIDNQEKAVNEIAEHVQSAVCLDARDFNSLNSVINDEFEEAIVCMAEDLESSILSVLHLATIGIKSIYAKSRSDDHARILRAIGATEIVFPERETSHRLANRILYPNLLDYVPLLEDHFVMEISVPEAIVGYTLGELHVRQRYGVYVIAIQNPAGQMKFMPGPDTKLQASDMLVAIGTEEALSQLEDAKPPKDEKNGKEG